MVVNRVLTRKVLKVIETHCGISFPKSIISKAYSSLANERSIREMIDINELNDTEREGIVHIYFARKKGSDPRYYKRSDYHNIIHFKTGIKVKTLTNHQDIFDAQYPENDREGWNQRPFEDQNKTLYNIYTRYGNAEESEVETAVKDIIASYAEEVRKKMFILLNIKKKESVQKLIEGEKEIVIEDCLGLPELVKENSLAFIVLSGDEDNRNVKWDTGLRAIGRISTGPYSMDKYRSKDRYKIGIKPEVVFEHSIPKDKFIYYKDTYEDMYTGDPDQTISFIKDTAAAAYVRGVIDTMPELESNIENIFPNEFMNVVHGPIWRLYPIPVNYGQTIEDALANKLKEPQIPKNEDKETEVDEQINKARLTGGENILLYGVPGSGKSYYIQEKYGDDPDYMERVVFHPDYTYSDFVGQILPRVEKENLRYAFTPGPFTKILNAAQHNPGKKYYLIIEEINRGNAPAIFGEIFQLLDRDDSGKSRYSITNYDIAAEVYGDSSKKISIPSNLWILATMNTSDQNVFTLDTAFQRRWVMKHIVNNIPGSAYANEMIEGSFVNWGTFATTVNEKIIAVNEGMVSSQDKRLGAYFISAHELKKDKFPEKVLKYMWDDAFRMDREAAFSKDLASLDEVISKYENTHGSDPLEAVLNASLYLEMLDRMNAGKKEEGDQPENQPEESPHSELDNKTADEEIEG